MRFHCDRCKTRYSIADERVRGKILKIRCKNCSAVITVREGMDGSPAGDAPRPATPRPAERSPSPRPAARPRLPSPQPSAPASPSALRGAFERAMQRPSPSPSAVASPAAPAAAIDPSPSDSFRAPEHFDEEWYVSIDGDQEGPYGLEAAKEWVSRHGPDAELYCWQEDFDDWLPVDKVSHFRGLRSRADTTAQTSAAPPIGAGAPPAPQPPMFAGGAAEEEPEPEPEALFSAAMRRFEEKQEHAPGTNGKASAAVQEMFPDDDDLDLDIGEASRIVKLSNIMPPKHDPDFDDEEPLAAPPPSGLPGVARIPPGSRLGRGSGNERAIPLAPLSDISAADAQPALLTYQPEPRRWRHLIPLIAGAAVVAIAVGLLIYFNTGGDTDVEGGLARSDVGGDELARQADPRVIRIPGQPVPSQADQSSGSTKTRRPSRSTTHSSQGTNNSTTNNADDGPKVPRLPGEEGVTALKPSDVIIMSRKQSLGTRRCYEQALRKDPFLEVKNIKVRLVVAASGVVTQVRLGSKADTFLGQCLTARIRAWPFRKSTGGITMDLTLSFEQAM